MNEPLTIVLLPGMDGTGCLFDPIVAALGPGFRVIVVSYPTDAALGYEALEAIARRSMPTKGAFIVLGESFSGPIAISLAASRPKGLVGLILCCTFVRNPRPAFKPFQALSGFLPIGRAPDRALNFFLLGALAGCPSSAPLKAAVSQVSDSASRARLRAVMDVDVSAKMRSVRVPVLYLQAARDRVVPRAAGAYLRTIHPATALISIDGPHCLLQVAPIQAAGAIARFAKDLRDV